MSTDPAFRMTIEGVFTIRGRGTIVTGRIERGTLKVGDEVQLQGRTAIKKMVVTGIESFRKSMLQAKVDDNVGVLLRDITKDDIQRGDVLVGAQTEFSWKP
jgi:elongation factor Tu